MFATSLSNASAPYNASAGFGITGPFLIVQMLSIASDFHPQYDNLCMHESNGGYPAKLKKVLIVTAPLWFKAPFKILRLFVREKVRERVFTVSAPQLPLHIPRAALPKRLGGPLHVDHAAWLLHCHKSLTNSNGSVASDAQVNFVPPSSDSVLRANGNLVSERAMTSEPMLADRVELGKQALNGDAKMHIIQHSEPKRDKKNNNPEDNNAINSDKNKAGSSGDEEDLKISRGAVDSVWCSDASSQCGSASSGFSDDDSLAGGVGGAGAGAGGAVTPAALLARVRSLGRRGLLQEYNEIKSRPPDGVFTHTKLKNNLSKNRYNDVLCYDHSRVLLSQTDDNDPCSDYINANYVDGYKQKNAFISTQGPLPNTFGDFWRMVWEQHSLVIVMTTSTVEQGRPKCGQYWPPGASQQQRHGVFNLLTETVDANPDYVVSELVLTNLETDESRSVSHWQFVRWPDYGVPGSAGAVLRFLAGARARQARGLLALGDRWAGHARGPPIVVHCSAGIGRTGTFCTLDICISRLEDTGLVDVRGTVEKIRSQRAYSIQMPDQYVFCHLAVIEYALNNGYLPSADLAAFNQDNDDESD